jgi:hypothetical protein
MRAWALVFICSCSSSSGPQGTTCIAGRSLACMGPQSCSGYQVCNPDGAGYGPCLCPADAAVTDAPATDAPTDAALTSDAMDAFLDAPPGTDSMLDAAADRLADAVDGPGTCDPTATTMTGCASSTPKCALTFRDPSAGTLECLAGGSGRLGLACQRTDTNMSAGVDDCAPGLFCSALGASTGRECRRVCSLTHNTCQTGEACFSLLEPFGVCRLVCDVFGPQSQCPRSNALTGVQTCQWGEVVGLAESRGFCNIGGPAAVGLNCNLNANPPVACAEGGTCLGDNRCHQLCDQSGSHDCPLGQRCTPAVYSDGIGGTVTVPGPMGGGWCVAATADGGFAPIRSDSSEGIGGPK